jgi:hypothetical protein
VTDQGVVPVGMDGAPLELKSFEVGRGHSLPPVGRNRSGLAARTPLAQPRSLAEQG